MGEPKLSRDEWMCVERALEDRQIALRRTQGFQGGPLRVEEVNECERLRRMIGSHVSATWKAPSAA